MLFWFASSVFFFVVSGHLAIFEVDLFQQSFVVGNLRVTSEVDGHRMALIFLQFFPGLHRYLLPSFHTTAKQIRVAL